MPGDVPLCVAVRRRWHEGRFAAITDEEAMELCVTLDLAGGGRPLFAAPLDAAREYGTALIGLARDAGERVPILSDPAGRVGT